MPNQSRTSGMVASFGRYQAKLPKQAGHLRACVVARPTWFLVDAAMLLVTKWSNSRFECMCMDCNWLHFMSRVDVKARERRRLFASDRWKMRKRRGCTRCGCNSVGWKGQRLSSITTGDCMSWRHRMTDQSSRHCQRSFDVPLFLIFNSYHGHGHSDCVSNAFRITRIWAWTYELCMDMSPYVN